MNRAVRVLLPSDAQAARRYLLQADDLSLLEDLDRPVRVGGLPRHGASPLASPLHLQDGHSENARTLCVEKRTRPNEPVPSVTPMSNCEPSSGAVNLLPVRTAAAAAGAGAAISTASVCGVYACCVCCVRRPCAPVVAASGPRSLSACRSLGRRLHLPAVARALLPASVTDKSSSSEPRRRRLRAPGRWLCAVVSPPAVRCPHSPPPCCRLDPIRSPAAAPEITRVLGGRLGGRLGSRSSGTSALFIRPPRGVSPRAGRRLWTRSIPGRRGRSIARGQAGWE